MPLTRAETTDLQLRDPRGDERMIVVKGPIVER